MAGSDVKIVIGLVKGLLAWGPAAAAVALIVAFNSEAAATAAPTLPRV